MALSYSHSTPSPERRCNGSVLDIIHTYKYITHAITLFVGWFHLPQRRWQMRVVQGATVYFDLRVGDMIS
jgi:hypothetical protein